MALSNDLGGFEVGEGKKVWETLQTDEKYTPLRSYWARLKERKSVKDTFYAVGSTTVCFVCFPD